MNKIETIQSKINGVLQMIQQEENRLLTNPNNLPVKFTLDSFKHQLFELQSELRIEKAKREKEFIEIRLKGRGADGSISFEFLSKLADGFAGTILNASSNIQFGTKTNKEKQREINDTVNLRLVGLAPGSTRLYVTANSSPDLFGNSLAEQSIEQSFRLLKSESPEQLTETASLMGKASVSKLRKFVSVINDNKMEVDIKWTSPANKSFEWVGESEKMLLLINSLSKIIMPAPERIQITGELITISLKGSFEIKDNDSGKTYKGTYSNELAEYMKQLNIGNQCTAEIEKRTVINQATEFEKAYYTLVSISKK